MELGSIADWIDVIIGFTGLLITFIGLLITIVVERKKILQWIQLQVIKSNSEVPQKQSNDPYITLSSIQNFFGKYYGKLQRIAIPTIVTVIIGAIIEDGLIMLVGMTKYLGTSDAVMGRAIILLPGLLIGLLINMLSYPPVPRRIVRLIFGGIGGMAIGSSLIFLLGISILNYETLRENIPLAAFFFTGVGSVTALLVVCAQRLFDWIQSIPELHREKK